MNIAIAISFVAAFAIPAIYKANELLAYVNSVLNSLPM